MSKADPAVLRGALVLALEDPDLGAQLRRGADVAVRLARRLGICPYGRGACLLTGTCMADCDGTARQVPIPRHAIRARSTSGDE